MTDRATMQNIPIGQHVQILDLNFEMKGYAIGLM